MEAHEVLGDAVLELGVEWTRFKREFELAGRYTVQQMDRMAESTRTFQMSIDKLGAGMRAFASGQTQFATVARDVRVLMSAFDGLTQSTEAYENTATAAVKISRDFAVAIESQRSSMAKATKEFDLYSRAMAHLHDQATVWKDDIDDQIRGLELLKQTMGEVIQLRVRMGHLGPMTTPLERQELRRDPAFQMVVRTESQRPGEGRGMLTPADVVHRMLDHLEASRAQDFAELKKSNQENQETFVNALGEVVKGFRGGGGQLALTQGGGVGPEFFDQFSQEMDKVMAPVRQAREQGINVSRLINTQTEESTKASRAMEAAARKAAAADAKRVEQESKTSAVAAAAEVKIADQVEQIASSMGPVTDAYSRFNELIRDGGPLSNLAKAFERQAEMNIGARGALERPGMLERQLEMFVAQARETLREAVEGHTPTTREKGDATAAEREAAGGGGRRVSPSDQDIIEIHQRQLEEAQAFYKEILRRQAPTTVSWFKGSKGGTQQITPDNAMPVAIVAASQSGLGPRAQQFEAQGGRVIQAPGGVETAVPTGQPVPGGQEVTTRVPSRAELQQALNTQESMMARLPTQFGGRGGLAPYVSPLTPGMTPEAFKRITGAAGAARPQLPPASGQQLGIGPGYETNVYYHLIPAGGNAGVTQGGPNRFGQLTPEDFDPFAARSVSFGQSPQKRYPVRGPAPVIEATAEQIARLQMIADMRTAMRDALIEAEQKQITAGGAGRVPPHLPPDYRVGAGMSGDDPWRDWNKRMDALLRLFEQRKASPEVIAAMQAGMPLPRQLRPGYVSRSEAEQLVLGPGMERGAGPFGANYPELRHLVETYSDPKVLAEAIAIATVEREAEAYSGGRMGLTAGQFNRYLQSMLQHGPESMFGRQPNFFLPGRGQRAGPTRPEIWQYILEQQALPAGADPLRRPMLGPGYGGAQTRGPSRYQRGQTYFGITGQPEGPQPGYTAYGGRGGEIVPYGGPPQDPYRHIVETLLTAMALQAENRARMATPPPTAFPQSLMHQLLVERVMQEGGPRGLPYGGPGYTAMGQGPAAEAFRAAEEARLFAGAGGMPGQGARYRRRRAAAAYAGRPGLPPPTGEAFPPPPGYSYEPPLTEKEQLDARIRARQAQVKQAREAEAAARAFADSLGLDYTPAGAGGGRRGGRGGDGGPGAFDYLRTLSGFGGRGGGGGGGARIPLPFFLGGAAVPGAAFGSLGSLAGLGPEHLLMTAGGVLGSAAMGAAGAGTLAAGALGNMAVGGGADVAVLKSTITDTQALSKSYQAVNQAIDTYGKGSQQAILATDTLNQQMRALGQTQKGQPFAPGVQAELGLAKSVDNMDKLWDKSTQNARVQAVKLMEQGVGLGTAYIPLVSKAAEHNLAIINTAIKPLFSWLKGPQGMQIFNDLEKQFAKNLPTAVHAFSQAIEVILRFVDAASKHTGGLTKDLDKFFTKLNDRSPQYFSDLVNRLVGDFRLWEHFVKLLGDDIYLLFKQDAGTGNAVVGTLDKMLTKLGDWEKSTRGAGQIHNLFEVHKDEAIALLHFLGELAKSFGHIYLTAAPLLTKAMTSIINVVGNLLGDLTKISPQITTVVGAMLFMQKLGVLIPMFKALKTAMFDTAAAETVLKLEGGGTVSIAGAGGKGGKGGGLASLLSMFGGGKGKAGAAAERTAIMDMSLLAGGGATAKEAESFLSKLKGGAGGSAIAGFGGYLAGTAAQGALGLKKGGTASAVGGIIGTVGGGAIGAAIGGPMGAMIGSGIGSGIATTLAPTVVHAFDSIFGIKPAEDYGKKWSAAFSKAMGPGFHTAITTALGPKTDETIQKNLASVTRAVGGARQHLEDLRKEPMTAGGRGGMTAAGEAQAVAKRQAEISAAEDKFKGLQFRKGSEAGLSYIAAMSNVKVPTELAFMQNMQNMLSQLGTPIMRGAAADHILAYTKSLQDHKKLPSTAVRDMIHAMEINFPGLKDYLEKAGEGSDKALADKMKMQHTQDALGNTLKNIQQEFGLFTDNPDVSGKNWLANSSKYATDLQLEISTTTGKAHRDAVEAFRQLRQGTAQHLAATVANVTDQTGKMHDALVGGSAKAATQAGKNFATLASSIASAMSSGTVSTAQGEKLIGAALNQTLKAFGEKPLALATIKSATAAQLQAVASGAVSSGALASRTERGGLIQVGPAGARGPDTIPMNVGGTPIIVGAGEQVAVFNASQQKVMNQRLGDYGGLGGFFNTVNQPHSMTYAQGGMVPLPLHHHHVTGGPLKRGVRIDHRFNAGGYVDPIPGFSLGRTDMGVDASAAPGTPILALGDSRLAGVVQGWYKNQPLLDFELLSGPDAGRFWYVAEEIIPTTERIGTTFRAGQVVARFAPTGTGIEIGWASNAQGQTLAQGTTGYQEGQVTQAGQSFSQFLTGLAHGKIVGGGPGAPQLMAPKVGGTGAVHGLVQGALNLSTTGANAYLNAHVQAGGVGGAMPMPNAGNWQGALRQLAQMNGWSVPDWMWIVQAESAGNPNAVNSSSGAFGLGQFLGATAREYAPYGALSHDPQQQIRAMAMYIRDRYGNPTRAKAFHLAHNWYERGGMVGRGFQRGGYVTRQAPPRPPIPHSKDDRAHLDAIRRESNRGWALGVEQANDLLPRPMPSEINKFMNLYHETWSKLSRFRVLPGFAHFPPVSIIKGDNGWDSRAYTLSSGSGTGSIHIPWGTLYDAIYPTLSNHNWAREGMVHELAHVYQNAPTITNVTLGEGGAQAWADENSGSVFPSYTNPGDTNYASYVNYVIRNKGYQWINQGQFDRSRHLPGDYSSYAAKAPPYERSPTSRKPPAVRPSRPRTGTSGSSTPARPKPAHRNTSKYRPPHLPHMPKLKIVGPLPADIYGPLNAINALEGKITDQQNLLSLLTGEEGLYPTAYIVSDADGNQTVNYGSGPPPTPVPFPPTAMTHGMMDPGSNQWVYGEDVRLGEIGPVGALGQWPGPIFPMMGPGGLRPDRKSELGIDEQILMYYNEEWQQAKKAMGPAQKHLQELIPQVGKYDKQGNFQPGLLQLRINKLTDDKRFLAPEKANAEIDLTTKYNHLKDKIRAKYHKQRLSSQELRVASINAITDQQSASDAAIATIPKSWLQHGSPFSAKAAQSAWHQEHAWEQSAITQRATAERGAVDDKAMEAYYKEAMDQTRALNALRDQESIERKRMNTFWTTRRGELSDLITGLQGKFDGAKTFLDALTGSRAGQSDVQQSGILGQLHGMLDPYGSLQTGSIATLQKVTIPTLVKEIATIKSTTPDSPQAASNAAADAANLAALQAQQMTIQAETIAGQASAFKVLTDAINTLPPYGGSFQEGGIVPGPLGEARTIIAHGGEEVNPTGAGGGKQSTMLIRMEDNRTRIYLDGVEQTVQMSTGTAARHARRNLPGRGGGLLS